MGLGIQSIGRIGSLAAPIAGCVAAILIASVTPGQEPGDPQPIEAISALLAQGQYDRAIEVATGAIDRNPKNAELYLLRGKAFERSGRLTEAGADYGRASDLNPNDSRGFQSRGEINFKLARFEDSVADFDRVLALDPRSAPYHWQRGISLYYAGRFADGAEQFWIHRTVNPNDVENAVWRFLCMARDPEIGAEKARAELLPLGRDSRRPMTEIYGLFRGEVSMEQVLEAAQTGPLNAAARRQSLFYAHLYLGLYYDVTGNKPLAEEHTKKAAIDFGADHYMGHVARIHYERFVR